MQHLLLPVIREAVRDGRYGACFEEARNLEGVDLAEALERVLEEEDEVRYDAMAARWTALAIDARHLTLHEVGWAATRFAENLEPYRDSKEALRGLLRDDDQASAPAADLNPITLFDEAMKAHDVEAAWDAARQAPRLSLDRALRLCLLLADKWDSRYEAAARRFLVRILQEVQPSVLEVQKLADALGHIHDTTCALSARAGLEDAVDQLGRRELRVDFA